MARRGLHPREADHMRGRGWSLGLRQTALPPDQNSMKSLSSEEILETKLPTQRIID